MRSGEATQVATVHAIDDIALHALLPRTATGAQQLSKQIAEKSESEIRIKLHTHKKREREREREMDIRDGGRK